MTDIFAQTEQTDNRDPAPVNYVEYVTSKFKTEEGALDVEALARGKYESDAFIAKLQAEQADLRKDLETRLALEEYLAKTMNKEPSNPESSSNSGQPAPVEQANKGTAIDENTIQELIRKTLHSENTKTTETQNLETTRSELMKAWGRDYSGKLEEKAKELGLGKEFLNKLAAQSPKAFLSLVGAEIKGPVDTGYAPPSTGARPQVGGNPVGVKNKAYYDKLKKADPKTYWSAKTQAEMHKDAIRLGESFFNI